MIGSVLTIDDFEQIVERCNNCIGGSGIRDYLHDIFKAHAKSNTRLEYALMEYLESKYYSDDFDEIEDLIEEISSGDEILNLKEDLPGIDNPAILYLYALLNQIIDIGVEETFNNDNKKYENRKNIFLTYKPRYELNQINEILERLKINGFCSFSEVSKVNWIFQDKSDINGEKIIWLQESTNNKGVCYRTIFYLIELVYPIDALKFMRGKAFCNEIRNRFKKAEDEEFQVPNLYQALRRYIKNKSYDKIDKLEIYTHLKEVVVK